MKGAMMNQPPHHQPSLKPSDEATVKGLRFVQEQGDVYHQALDYMASEVEFAHVHIKTGQKKS